MPEAQAPAAPAAGQHRTDMNPATWVADHGDALFRYAYLKVRSEELAEDLIQETFLAALAARSRFRGGSSVRTWLTGILRRKVADHFRGRGAPTRAELPAGELPSPAADLDPAKACEQAEFWRVYHACTAKLPEPLAEAYHLREVLELPTGEICELLGVTAGNIAVRLHRAREALRECLDRRWFRPDRASRSGT